MSNSTSKDSKLLVWHRVQALIFFLNFQANIEYHYPKKTPIPRDTKNIHSNIIPNGWSVGGNSYLYH